MLFVFTGTDRAKAREAMNKKISSLGKNTRVVRITDAHTADDLRSVLRGPGMFGETQLVVCDGMCAKEDMRAVLLEVLPALRESTEPFFVLEEKPDKELSHRLKKYAEEHAVFNAKKEENKSMFALANAMRARDKKALWLAYQKELLKGSTPEAVHGVLFWAAKDMALKAGDAARATRARRLVIALTELPHDARRRGVELEYALEHLTLTGI